MANKRLKQQISNKYAKRRILIAKSIVFFREYPEIFIEEMLEIKLNIYQKALVRAFFDKKSSLWVLSRGLGKSWLGALCLITYCMLYRGTLAGVIAPSFRQSKMVIEDKIVRDIMERSPFLRSEIKKWTVGQAEAKIEFFNGSRILAVPTGDGKKLRGYRFHIILADEYAQIPKEIIDLVIGPMLNVKRGYEVGKTEYEDEIGNRILAVSSAYYKHNHLYDLTTQYVDEVVNGNNKYFVSIMDYTVGLAVGLFDEDHIEKEKKRLSPIDFDMEYGCLFPNLSDKGWINPEDLQKCSTLKNFQLTGSNNYEYTMGIDVARVEGNDNTVIHVFKLVPLKGRYEKHLVYTKSMNGVNFENQAKEIRKLLKMFPSTVRIFMDVNGLGLGLTDELSKPYWDAEEQKEYSPIIDMNDAQAVKDVTNGIPLIYGIKPTNEINHKVGMAVKTATQKGLLKMYSLDAGDVEGKFSEEPLTFEEEVQILEAEQTRREVMAIIAEPAGVYLKFSPMSKKHRKDRWSALGYGLYGAEIIEEERNIKNDIPLVGAVSQR